MALDAPQRVRLVNPVDEAQAASRLAILEVLFDYQRDPTRFEMLRLQDGTPVTSSARMFVYLAESTGNSERTLKRWLALYKEGGRPALADKQRSDKNTSRFFSAYPKAAWLAAYLYLECKQSFTVCHEAIVRDAALIEVPEEDIPSLETVRKWLRSMPPSLTVYARNGRKAYRDRMSPWLKRGFTDVYSNSVWVGDASIADVECSNDCFDDAEWGAPIRIRLDAMMDYRSRMFVGASWCWEGSSRSIAATMRRGILRYGPPEHLYVDNGLPYKKVAKGALPGYLKDSPLAPAGWRNAEIASIQGTGFLARLGIAVTHCIPYSPQSKAIERAFRTVHERFDKCWPTYTSGSPFTRPDYTEAAMMRHRKLLKAGRAEESNHPLASHYIAACAGWMEEYADTVHGGEGMDGGTPRQVFEANRNPHQKPPPDYATLSLLMAEHTKRKVRECAITLGKRRYVPVDQAGWADLHRLNECEAVVAHDPVDVKNAALLDLDGNFIAWLQTEELVRFAPGDPTTQRQIADSMATRRRLEKGNREAIALVSRAARANGAQSPLEAMAARLQLSAGESGVDIISQRKPRLAPTKQVKVPKTCEQVARELLED